MMSILYGILTTIIVSIAVFIYRYLTNIATERNRTDYFDTLKKIEFRRFKTDVIKALYSDLEFPTINGHTFPICLFPYHSNDCEEVDNSDERWIRKYDGIINRKESDKFEIDLAEHQGYKHFPGYQMFHLIMKRNIRYPDRPCFTLKKLETNEMGEMLSLSVGIGTYGENAYSNQVLEYELYRKYKKHEQEYKKNSCDLKAVSKELVLRNAKQKKKYENTKDFLCDGVGRYSMLAVQMLVLIRKGNSFKVMIVQRSNIVAVAPGDYQMVPAGAFEIFNNNAPEYAEHVINNNLSPGAAVFREYLEEILGNPNANGFGPGGVDVLLGNADLQKVYKLLDEKKAAFRFLGIVADLVYLRDYLSFVLLISDPKYYEYDKFLGNEEAMNNEFVRNVTIDNIEEGNYDWIWDNLFGPSAGMWELFKQLIDNNDEEITNLLKK